MSTALTVTPAPHLRSGSSVDRIMLHVVLALLPACGWAVYAFGLGALLGLLTAACTCVLVEHAWCRLVRRETTISDYSALITGMLLALTLPPGLPLWMVNFGAVTSILLGKALFGGLGNNCFNPALVGRAILQAAFPAAMTQWTVAFAPDRFSTVAARLLTPPLMRPPEIAVLPLNAPALAMGTSVPTVDGLSAATPLSAFKFGHRLSDASDLLLGWTSGSSGETSAVLIVLGGLWLVSRRAMNYRIALAIFASVAVLTAVLSTWLPERCPPVPHMLLSGGLVLGATFMATDSVGSPLTDSGCWVYGTLIGVLVVTIRVFGAMPEGVMYAILLGNAATPLIDRWCRPRTFGTRRVGTSQ